MDAQLKLEVWNIDQSEDACLLKGFRVKRPHHDPLCISNSVDENGSERIYFKSEDGVEDPVKYNASDEEEESEEYAEFDENEAFSVVELDPKGEDQCILTFFKIGVSPLWCPKIVKVCQS